MKMLKQIRLIITENQNLTVRLPGFNIYIGMLLIRT